MSEVMNVKFSISWLISKSGKSVIGRRLVDRWEKIWFRLSPMQMNDGSFSLEILDAPDLGPFRMAVMAESGYYLMTLTELGEDGTYVRDYTNPDVEFEMVELHGNMWDSRLLTRDFELVQKLFEEFFRTGDVSEDWLQ